ncbi:hypothetical protein N7450_000715 [Penicillium hetheringtonii]|uniref:Lysophospholipase A n=1 Tax=Penicillium hetheringtonii TaxID=911720 RepID=A0AAD6E2K8_9EURO|nr:hypothetical protein N7450_000715 [Penicillium hetheringtonii]
MVIKKGPTSTAEGGPNWVEYLTECGIKPGLISPQSCEKQLWDFAFAGSDISTDYIPLHHNFTVSLINQTLQYQQYAYKPLSKLFRPKESLIAIWIGINDINDSSKYSVDFAKFYENLIKTVFNSVTDLYNLGHRSFLFMNLPPLDRTPGNQASSSPHPNATQIKWYNDALIEHAHLFQREKMDVEARVFDAHTHLSKILDHPARYGIVNTTNYCAGYNQPDIEENYSNYGCPTPLDQYFWFNSGHMTSHVHQILAEELQQWLKSS